MAEQFLSAQTVTLKQYLSRDNGQYTIPFSQRPYEWGEAQVNRLFKDLTALGLSENSEDKHVLNFFTFSNEEGSLKLFDGQQRTVTTLMIYAEGLKIA
ncbi:MAG: GmrSD restriction endonuclease domain-containing protein, partial [Weissella cibaria]